MFAGFLLGALLDTAKLAAPVTLKMFDPIVHGLQLPWVEAIQSASAAPADRDDSNSTQHAQVFGDGRLPNSQCNTLFPSFAFPRYIAGGPLAANNIKCQLKPVDLGDYQVSLTSAEITRLQTMFPQGVCDWSKPGVNRTGVVPWASFGPAPENLVFDVTK